MYNLGEKAKEKIYGIKESNLAGHILHDIKLAKRFKVTEAAGFVEIQLFLTTELEESEVSYKIDFETYHKFLYNPVKKLKGAKK